MSIRKAVFTTLTCFIVIGCSPRVHSSTTVFSCPCNDTKGCGDFARECCTGLSRLRRSTPHEDPESTPISPLIRGGSQAERSIEAGTKYTPGAPPAAQAARGGPRGEPKVPEDRRPASYNAIPSTSEATISKVGGIEDIGDGADVKIGHSGKSSRTTRTKANITDIGGIRGIGAGAKVQIGHTYE